MDAASSSEGPRKRHRKRSRKSRTKGEEDGEDGVTKQDVQLGQQSMKGEENIEHPSEVTSNPQPSSNGGPSAAAPSSILASNPHKPSVLPQPSIYGPRQYTLSVALPSSIIHNAQTMELKTRLVGSMARICAVFNVDEIVVFDDTAGTGQQQQQSSQYGGRRYDDGDSSEQYGRGGYGAEREPLEVNSFMAMILQYLETPPYMRRTLFPMHPHLRQAGLLPPLDCPHHLRLQDESPYREGLVVEAPSWASSSSAAAGNKRKSGATTTAWVHVGPNDPIECRVKAAVAPPVGTRVTVEMPSGAGAQGLLVSPRTPVHHSGLYWGYSVRLASSLSQVFTNSPFPAAPSTNDTASAAAAAAAAEYDLVIGTAERGDPLTDVLYATQIGQSVPSSKTTASRGASKKDIKTVSPLPSGFKHALVLFGGLSGLEVAIEADEGIPLGLEDAEELCDFWVDVAEGQGSRTVRTEEALTITLARLKTSLEQLGAR